MAYADARTDQVDAEDIGVVSVAAHPRHIKGDEDALLSVIVGQILAKYTRTCPSSYNRLIINNLDYFYFN